MLPKTMLAVVKEKAGPGITVKLVAVPTLKKGEVLVKVLKASICGTDIGIYNWSPWAASHIKPPKIIGHEVVGEVISLGGVTDQEIILMAQISPEGSLGDSSSMTQNDISVGDIVSSETHIFCNQCYQCKIGNYHVCEKVQFFGFGRDGGFAQYTTIPVQTTWKNPSTASGQAAKIPLEAMSVQEPLGNSVHAVTKGNVKGKKVLIVGLGPVGLCAAAVANVYGASKVSAIDPSDFRCKLAQKFTSVDTSSKLVSSHQNKYDVVIEASGVEAGLQASLEAAQLAGTIVAVGIPKKAVCIDWGKYIIDKELTIKSIFGRRIWETWRETSALLSSGKIDLTKIITHRFPLSQFEAAMRVAKSGECGKILLEIG